jgi:hypothetical protein
MEPGAADEDGGTRESASLQGSRQRPNCSAAVERRRLARRLGPGAAQGQARIAAPRRSNRAGQESAAMSILSADEGYYTPYAKYLEKDVEAISKILGKLILAHGEGKPIDAFIPQIEEWLGDDWYVDLSKKDQKRLDAIKGWTYR